MKFSGDTAAAGPGLHLENLSFGERCLMVPCIYTPKMLFPTWLCTFLPVREYRIGLGSSFSYFLSFSIQEGMKEIPLPHPIHLTPLLHPSLTYQDGITKTMVLADSFSTGPQQILRSLLSHREGREGTTELWWLGRVWYLLSGSMGIMRSHPCWGMWTGNQGHSRVFTVWGLLGISVPGLLVKEDGNYFVCFLDPCDLFSGIVYSGMMEWVTWWRCH